MAFVLPPPDAGVVFCDFLTCTIPADDWPGFRPELESILDGIFCESPQPGVYICPFGGWVKVGKRAGVTWVQASGGVLGALRIWGLFPAYLRIFAGRSHRVTRLDASLDVAEDAQPIVHALYLRASAGEVALSQKAVRPSGVQGIFSPSRLDGRHTGTVYVGRHTAEVRLVVYDKREEFARRGGADIGCRVRYELRVTDKMGATLRDAGDPAALFWRFMSPGVLPAPPGTPEWVGSDLGGFSVDRPEVLPYERLKRRVENSVELPRLLALADALGPEGRRLFDGLVRKFYPPGVGAGAGEFVGELAPEAG